MPSWEMLVYIAHAPYSGMLSHAAGDYEYDISIRLTSLLPRPKPLITGPLKRSGNGASGPESGPTIGSLGPLGGGILNVAENTKGVGVSRRFGYEMKIRPPRIPVTFV